MGKQKKKFNPKIYSLLDASHLKSSYLVAGNTLLINKNIVCSGGKLILFRMMYINCATIRIYTYKLESIEISLGTYQLNHLVLKIYHVQCLGELNSVLSVQQPVMEIT